MKYHHVCDAIDWMTQSKLSKIETGERKIDVFELLELAEIYKTTVGDLLRPLSAAEKKEIEKAAAQLGSAPVEPKWERPASRSASDWERLASQLSK